MNEVEKQSLDEKNINWDWKRVRIFLSHIGLLFAFMIYTVIGALVFQELERPSEIVRVTDLLHNLEDSRVRLIQASGICSKDPAKCDQLLNDYESAVTEACQGGIHLPYRDLDEIPTMWSFPQSAFFATTVLTTIGYGDVVPNTLGGRVFCIFFAIIGIPLTVSLIADLGVLLATAISAAHEKLSVYIPRRVVMPTLSNSVRRWLAALAGILALIFYLAAGAALFMVLEKDWGFFEGFYFCFITMTTIGFGDFVPESPKYMLMCTLYILVGLALTSTIIELVRRQYARSWKTLQSLSGPLADSLRRLGETTGTGIDVFTLQSDLKKILMMGVPRKTDDGKEWQDAIDSVLQDIGIRAPIKKRPQVLQIVVYETTV